MRLVSESRGIPFVLDSELDANKARSLPLRAEAMAAHRRLRALVEEAVNSAVDEDFHRPRDVTHGAFTALAALAVYSENAGGRQGHPGAAALFAQLLAIHDTEHPRVEAHAVDWGHLGLPAVVAHYEAVEASEELLAPRRALHKSPSSTETLGTVSASAVGAVAPMPPLTPFQKATLLATAVLESPVSLNPCARLRHFGGAVVSLWLQALRFQHVYAAAVSSFDPWQPRTHRAATLTVNILATLFASAYFYSFKTATPGRSLVETTIPQEVRSAC